MTLAAPSPGASAAAHARPHVSVIIKTLNEEKHVGRAVESALAAVAPFKGDVTVVDSASTDRTVEIASRYPIGVVELADPGDRSCGVGPELGYRHSTGQYIYLLDGDMELDAGFLEDAVGHLDRDPRLAGVGGRIEDVHVEDIDSKVRVQRAIAHQAGPTDRLNGGGLYRRTAIEQVGYLGDRNLHSFEEFDVGARLLGKGWRLAKLDRTAARHFGYTLNPYRLLLRRFESGYAFGIGEVVRAALATGYASSLARLRGLAILTGVLLCWLAVIVLLVVGGTRMALGFAVLMIAASVVVMTLRRRSLQIGVYSVVAWHANALGLLIGLFRHRTAPTAPIPCRLIRTPVSTSAGTGNQG